MVQSMVRLCEAPGVSISGEIFLFEICTEMKQRIEWRPEVAKVG